MKTSNIQIKVIENSFNIWYGKINKNEILDDVLR